MMGNTAITNLLNLLFNGTTWSTVANNATVSPLTSLYLALHTADPGAAGAQNTSEAGYSGYARQPVTRDNTGFTISSQSVTLTAAVNFPAAPTDATDNLKFWSVGTVISGAGQIFYSGPIGVNLGVGSGFTSDTITIPGLSGVAVSDRIVFEVPTGGTIPTGLTAGTVYFVKTLSGNDITVSTTDGGATIDITAAGQVLALKVTPIQTGSGISVTPQLTTGSTITLR